MYRISESLVGNGSGGYWKSNGSGVRSDFYTFTVAWAAFTLDSVFLEDFKNRKWDQLLAGGLRGALDLNVDAPPPAPALAGVVLNKRAVFLKTVSVRDLNGVDRCLGLGDADMYARVMLNNQQFVEAMQLDKSSVRPTWTTIKFIDATIDVVTVHYELWDEDDEHLDVNADGRFKDLDFFYNVNTCQLGGLGIKGVFDTPARLFGMQGIDEDRARLEFSSPRERWQRRPHAVFFCPVTCSAL